MGAEYRYTVNGSWTVGRRGFASAAGVPQAIEFSAPPEFKGEPEMWTPEHFFTAALAACFVSTFRAIAEYSKFEDMVALEVDVEAVLRKEEGGFRFVEVITKPVLTIASAEDEERGFKLLEKADKACLVSRSINAERRLEAKVLVATPV
jgi:organic hydroperoxide reductase OsmC/OhrA